MKNNFLKSLILTAVLGISIFGFSHKTLAATVWGNLIDMI
jgi:hypothetical protein